MRILLLIVATLVLKATSLSLKTADTKEYCFAVKGKPGQYLHFSYLVRGRNEDNVALKVTL
jgi:hypothetical protein